MQVINRRPGRAAAVFEDQTSDKESFTSSVRDQVYVKSITASESFG